MATVTPPLASIENPPPSHKRTYQACVSPTFLRWLSQLLSPSHAPTPNLRAATHPFHTLGRAAPTPVADLAPGLLAYLYPAIAVTESVIIRSLVDGGKFGVTLARLIIRTIRRVYGADARRKIAFSPKLDESAKRKMKVRRI